MNPRSLLPNLRRLAAENKLFSWALAAGALLRLITVLGYPGALFFYGDSYVYLGAALRPQPNLSKVTGYSFFLRMLLPFHSLTLVVTLQHLMGLSVAVMIYVLLRRNGVSKTWSAVATLPQLLDGYIIEDEHLIMTETLFTFLLMITMLIALWKPRPAWWNLLIAGVLVGCAAVVRTEGEVMLVVIPLFLLLRGWSWKTLRGWLMTITFAVASLLPMASYEGWFHDYYPQYHQYDMSLAEGFFLWGRVSSFANCAVIKLTPAEAAAKICPTDAIVDRTPPGNFVWENPYIHDSFLHKDFSPVTPANDKLLTGFAERAIEAQPLDYVKTVVKDVLLSFGFPRIAYPGAGTTFYYDFHLHYVVAPSATTKGYSTLPPKNKSWIGPNNSYPYSAYHDWLAYGRQAPGVVNKVFAVPILIYERVVFTWGPLLAVIFLVGLGGVISVTASAWRRGQGLRSALSFRTLRSVRLHWAPRGTSMLPWVCAVALLVAPIMVADFDYRYLIPVIPFACLAAGLSFAPRRTAVASAASASSTEASTEAQASTRTETDTAPSTVPDSIW